MSKPVAILFATLFMVGVILVSGFFYTVDETEQVIITQFGKPMGKPVVDAGLHFKMPFIQEVNRLEKRALGWDGMAKEIPTLEKEPILVDTFARWKIVDPSKFFVSLRDLRSARSRLDDILDSATRDAVAKHKLIEIIRTSKDRVPAPSGIADEFERIGKLEPISKGRSVIEAEILESAKSKVADLGIELLDIRFKRINYNERVRKSIYERMISERQQIAERFRSEGAGEAARILGTKEKEVKTVQSEAYKTIQSIQGEADAKATEIYAQAYNQNPEAASFFEFTKTMETYKEVLGQDTTVILSTDSDFLGFLKSMNGSNEETPSFQNP